MLLIMIILIAVLGLVVVNAMKHSPWATSTVFATVPIAILVGLYLRRWRPGRVLEASVLGVALILFAVVSGGWGGDNPPPPRAFHLSAVAPAALCVLFGCLPP